jgi:hypothetical protein
MISWILFTAVFIRCSLIQDVKGQTKPDCNLKIGQKCALKYSTSFLMVGDERWIPGIGDRVVEVRSINGDTVEVAGASKTGTAPCSELVDLDHAEDFFKKESMRLPDSMFPQTTLAFCMRAQGDLNLAVSYLSQAIDNVTTTSNSSWHGRCLIWKDAIMMRSYLTQNGH